MKLSEALVLRADTQKRVERLRERLRLSVLVQEGEQPPEDPQVLFSELDELLAQLRDLISRINRTNLSASLESGTSLTAALAQRDVLKLRYGILKSAADVASNRIDRYSRTEIRSVPTVNVATLRRDLDALSQQYRELDTAIQAANWSTELEDQ
jgi:hypothetical protein